MSCWRDARSAIGLGYDLLRYMASVLLPSESEYVSFSKAIDALRQFSNARPPISDRTFDQLAERLGTLQNRMSDFDFAPHPEPTDQWRFVSKMGFHVAWKAVGVVSVLIKIPSMWCDEPSGSFVAPATLDSFIDEMWRQPWLKPHEVTEIVAVARWRDATGKRTLPRGDRWLAFQTMIEAREIDAAYMFASGRVITG